MNGQQLQHQLQNGGGHMPEQEEEEYEEEYAPEVRDRVSAQMRGEQMQRRRHLDELEEQRSQQEMMAREEQRLRRHVEVSLGNGNGNGNGNRVSGSSINNGYHHGYGGYHGMGQEGQEIQAEIEAEMCNYFFFLNQIPIALRKISTLANYITKDFNFDQLYYQRFQLWPIILPKISTLTNYITKYFNFDQLYYQRFQFWPITLPKISTLANYITNCHNWFKKKLLFKDNIFDSYLFKI